MDHELAQYLDDRFELQEQRFNARFDAIDRRFEAIDQRFDRQEQRFNARFDVIDQRIEEVKRHTGVLVEGLRHEVQLVAEGFAVFIEGRYAQDQANIAQQFQETRALIHLSYDQLRQRVENLERKPSN
jgi:ubiquinone biosynthesis protein UbiJ